MTMRILLAAAIVAPMFALLPACQTSDTRFSSTDQSNWNQDQNQNQAQNPYPNPDLDKNPDQVDPSRNPAASNANTGENIAPGDTQRGMATEGR